MPTKTTLSQKQENFCLNIFQGLTQRESWINAGYSSNYSLAIVDVRASELMAKGKIRVRIGELRAKVETDAVSTVQERLKMLTNIERAKIGDFVDENGNLDVTKDKLNNSAVQEIRTERTLTGVKTTLKLRDPIAASDQHNKVDKLYSDTGNDNRPLVIQINWVDGKKVIDQVDEEK